MNKKNQFLEVPEKNNMLSIPSCTIEEAVMYLLGFSEESIKPVWVSKSQKSSDGQRLECPDFDFLPDSINLSDGFVLKNIAVNTKDGEWLDSTGFDFLSDSFNLAESELQDAINEKSLEEIIKQKSDKYERIKQLISEGQFYHQAIVDELNNGTAFHTIKNKTNVDGYPSIQLLSLKKWAKEVLKITILDNFQLPVALAKAINLPSEELPWIKDKQMYNDPPTTYDWQLAARFFAIEFLKTCEKNVTQIELATEVEKMMRAAKYTYGVNSFYNAPTIRKAFPKFKFNKIKLSLIYEFFQKTP